MINIPPGILVIHWSFGIAKVGERAPRGQSAAAFASMDVRRSNSRILHPYSTLPRVALRWIMTVRERRRRVGVGSRDPVTQETATMQRTLVCTSLGVALVLSAMSAIAAAEDYTKPTKQHEGMAHEVGIWDADVTMWMDPEAEPQKSKAVETNEMLGKMWLMGKFDGEFMGEKFMGRSAMGYDPIKKKYVGGWVDSMSPFMFRMEGDYDEDSKTLTMMGESVDCMTGKPMKSKMVTTYEGDGKKTFEMYRLGDDGELVKTMEAKYTRRK
jgi:hypothetical protein